MTCLTLSWFNLPSTSVALDTVLDGTVGGLEASKDIITSAVPVPGLGIALDLLVEVLKKIQNAKTNSKALKSLCKETEALADTLKQLAGTIYGGLEEYPAGSPERIRVEERFRSSRKLLDRVERLESALRTVCCEADKLDRRTCFGRFLHSSDDAEAVNDMKNQIATAHRLFQVEGDVTTEAIVTEMLNDMKRVIAEQQKIADAQKLEEEERVLRSIPRAEGAHYLSAANAPKARFQRDTRTELFDCLDAWVKDQTTGERAKPVCVLVGEAGTGKSTIASEFSKRLEEHDRLGASFFFTRGVQDLNSPRKFFATISSQLARSQPALRVPVIDAAREHLKSEVLQQLELEYQDLIVKPLAELPPTHPPFFVVVDALDECTEGGPELIPTTLRLLLSCAARPGSPLRVFLTSRPEPHYIHRVFEASDIKPHVSLVSIQTFRSSIDDDIGKFIRARFNEDETSQAWYNENASNVVPTLVERSNGLFIYARTAVDFILGDFGDPLPRLKERYDLLLPTNQERGMQAPLDSLDTLYHTVLGSVLPSRDRDPQMQERLKRVLEYLAVLQEPDGISPTTLEALTAMPSAHSLPILNRLRSVIFFERNNTESPFRIVHATFREFLVDRARATDMFHIDPGQVHSRLADHCMATIRAFRTTFWQDTSRVALVRQLHTDQGSAKPRLFPHVCYAYYYIDYHQEHSYRDNGQDLPCQPDNHDARGPVTLVNIWRTERGHSNPSRLQPVNKSLRYLLPTHDHVEEFVNRMYNMSLRETPSEAQMKSTKVFLYVEYCCTTFEYPSTSKSEDVREHMFLQVQWILEGEISAVKRSMTAEYEFLATTLRRVFARQIERVVALGDAEGTYTDSIIPDKLDDRCQLEDELNSIVNQPGFQSILMDGTVRFEETIYAKFHHRAM